MASVSDSSKRGDHPLEINTTELCLSRGSGSALQTLCNGLYLRARPGTLTAIMGPSGCGKSVFLRLLTGYERPTKKCHILFGKDDLWIDRERVLDILGYVPQAEIMIPELRVAESLDYRMRFRSPGSGPQQRREQIRKTCAMLGLGDLDKLFAKPVGSPESRGEYPSGGERRRINIAHEVLSQPRVLFMDEPTSGLAAIEAYDLIKQMRLLAETRSIPIVMTIHAPGRDTFDCFDDVLVVGMGGVLGYYGWREKVVDYFRETTPVGYLNENPAEYVLKCVPNDLYAGAQAARCFKEKRDQPGFEFLHKPWPLEANQAPHAPGSAATQRT